VSLFKKEKSLEDIIDDCKTNNRKAQEELYKQFFGYGMSIATRYAHCPDEAHEIVNDGFMKVFDKIDSYNTTYAFKSWFRAIVVNTAVDYYRKNGKYRLNTEIEQADRSEYSQEIIDSLTVDNILELLNSLSDNQRLLFNLFEIEGYSHKEIAQMLDITETASRTTLTRAKKALRDLYYNHFDKDETYSRHSLEQPY
jgi:RNA polymerase sigma-70 factor (ECF subfamily)